MSSAIEISQSMNCNAEKRAKMENQDTKPFAVSFGEHNAVANQKDNYKPIEHILSAPNQTDGNQLSEENNNDVTVHEIFKISPSKELKFSEDETSSEAIETVEVNEFNEREKLEEELRRVDFMIRNRKQSLIELETYRSNHSLTGSHDSKGTNENSETSITNSSSSCDSECEREPVEPKDSKQNFLSNLRQMMPSFHLIGDIDQRLAQLNINTSQNFHNPDRAQCDLVLQALDVLKNKGITPAELSSPYPITEFLFEKNNGTSI